MRSRFKSIVEESDTVSGRAFDLVIQGLIIVSLITFAIDTVPSLSTEIRALLGFCEALTVVVFSVEYFLRLWVHDRPLRFATSFYGLVDLAAILPFYLATGLDLRSVRAFRLLRLFRILKLSRYTEAIRRITAAFRLAKEELVLYLTGSAVVLYLSSVGFYYVEGPAQPERVRSVFDGIWWAVSTLTTVGYGDIYPVTAAGRLFTGVVLIVGLGIVAVPAGVVASALSRVGHGTRNSRN